MDINVTKYPIIAIAFSIFAFTHIGLNAEDAHSSHSGKVHWSYSGQDGPEHWAELDPKFEVAKSGQRQSPIDLNSGIHADLSPIEFDYKDSPLSPLRVVNNGHTIKVDYKSGSHMTVEGQTYELLQFHFHTPSEHTKNSKHSPMELHFVHKNADEELAVVGVFIEEGQANSEIEKIWSLIPKDGETAKNTMGQAISAAKLLPEHMERYEYHGSLTTPPCTEGVLWLVMDEPIHLSSSQIGTFRNLFHANARPIQECNSRFILTSK